ncbi:hypothetical protein [Nocardia donostiensis]|uniref:ATPase n=1 Tax=Nocardia donostiensis TaxID=1538463 RepID=A0A1W0BMM0_9NOCA|nr:hypothetical protein [Nocardia donostiensis]ONM50353.1 hypothetical protein B0T46_03955 [Nocardia donostiensis]OQS16016.1 hypothetical protein B0T36_08050 [Nocardia donostiensis]OQS23748.1 hypothetical protein B0T44_02490 [Nocardia donostiensis]
MATMSTLGEVRPEHDCAGDLVSLHYLRSFRRPVLEVWAACTEPRQLLCWLGAISGSGNERSVEPVDGPFHEPIELRIERCIAPHELVAEIGDAALELRLDQVGVVTNLELVRRRIHAGAAAVVGPRWQFLLDRFTAYLERKPVPRWPEYPDVTAEYR